MYKWIALLVLVAVILGAAVYLDNKQKWYSKEVEESLANQIETWAKTRESLFQDTESKKQTMLLLEQQERTRQLEDLLNTRLQDINQQQDKFQQEVSGKISGQQADYNKFTEDINKRLQNYAQQGKDFEERLEKSLQAKLKLQQETISRLKKIIDKESVQQFELAKQIDQLRTGLDDLAEDVRSYRLKTMDFEGQLQDLKRRVDRLE